MSYRVGKRRGKLFSREARRSLRVPVSLLILAAAIALFSLVSPSTFLPAVNPANVQIPAFTATPTPLPLPTDAHGGDIVFTCTRGETNQICMIKADGTGYRQLTSGNANSYYPAISPDGEKVVYAVNRYDYFDLYQISVRVLIAPQATTSKTKALTDSIGNAFSASFSPSGDQILFVNRTDQGPSALWVMGADGQRPHKIYEPSGNIVGAAWAPDGRHAAVTMATESAFAFEVFIIDLEALGSAPRQISHGISGIGGSISWSPDQKHLLIFAGPAAAREIYRLDVDTGQSTQLTFGGNNASPAYSPDGQYIVFNSLRNKGQADLYIMRADGHSMRQLTDNPEPDWQPQWGR